MKHHGISTMIRYLQVKIDKILIIRSKFISRFLSFLRTNVILSSIHFEHSLDRFKESFSLYHKLRIIALHTCSEPLNSFSFRVFFFFSLRGNMKNIGIHVISPRAVYSRRETISQIYAADRECFLATVSSYT